jgi:hypothetical protein
MTDWTLAAIKASHLSLEAYCQTEGCKHFFVFDLDLSLLKIPLGQGTGFPTKTSADDSRLL